MARRAARTRIRGYYDESGVRWLTVSEALYIFNHFSLFPISDATWRRRCRAGTWTRLGIRVRQPMPGYWMTDAQTLYDFMRLHHEDDGAKLKRMRSEMARERREWEEDRVEPDPP